MYLIKNTDVHIKIPSKLHYACTDYYLPEENQTELYVYPGIICLGIAQPVGLFSAWN